MKIKVNNQPFDVDPFPGETLAELLRNRLHLTGTKIGCNEAECGACTVIVDSEPVLACTYPAARAADLEIVTIEGLADRNNIEIKDNRTLHPLQEAFVLHGAVQCGFCIPGQLMTAHALLEKNPNPDTGDIRHALKDTLCRCAGYPTIERSILAAAKKLRTGDPLEAPTFGPSNKPLHSVGTPQIRPDAVSKVTGEAIFTDDLKFDNMLFARAKRALVPHGTLSELNIESALALPGVAAVLVAEDIPGEQNHGVVIFDWPAMIGVGERVRYVGDAVAIVAAETEVIAAQAIELIEAKYELLEVIDNPVRSREVDAPLIHDTGNLLKHIKVRKGDLDLGFSTADIVLEHTFHTQTTDHAFLEPECSIALINSENRMEIYVGSQIPYADRNQIARALNWSEDRVRVLGQLMGGGFGGKEDIAGQIHVALLAKVTGRPVKLLFDRRESLLVHPKRHATKIHVKLGAKKNGQLTAVQSELYGDTGAYASLGEKVMGRATTHSSGPYDIPHVKADCYAMYTNNPPSGAFRGFGALQGQFAIENMMDILASELNLDPVELRRINALKVGSSTNTGQLLTESVGLIECIELVDAEMHLLSKNNNPFAPVPVENAPHLVRSWGFAAAYKNTGLGGGAPDKAGAEVELYPDGILEVRTSSAELGQGLVTVLQLIVAEVFSIAPENIRVLVMDTDLTPDGGPTTASRQSYVTGNAAYFAAKTLRDAMASSLAEKYDYPPDDIRFVEGLAQVGEQNIQLGDIVACMRSEGFEPRALYEYWAPETKPLGLGGKMHFAFSFAAQAVEIEVNTKTGEVSVLKVIAANDVGKALNPLGLQGQIEGGIIMGIGHALTENYIVEKGIPFTDRMARYRIPNISQTPKITSFIVENATADGPYGAKGVGEIVSIPTIPAITNAIYNAIGVRVDSLPVDQAELIKKVGYLAE